MLVGFSLLCSTAYIYSWHIGVLCLFDFISVLYGWFISSARIISFRILCYHVAYTLYDRLTDYVMLLCLYLLLIFDILLLLVYKVKRRGKRFISSLIMHYYILSIRSIYLSCILCKLYLLCVYICKGLYICMVFVSMLGFIRH